MLTDCKIMVLWGIATFTTGLFNTTFTITNHLVIAQLLIGIILLGWGSYQLIECLGCKSMRVEECLA